MIRSHHHFSLAASCCSATVPGCPANPGMVGVPVSMFSNPGHALTTSCEREGAVTLNVAVKYPTTRRILYTRFSSSTVPSVWLMLFQFALSIRPKVVCCAAGHEMP
ncbi:MAG: hypothetical protein [Circular genetic element sp.]|nr:MAG: hypothetical protein [Circular genetic element sp.]